MRGDVADLPELIGEIYDAALDPERWASFVARLSNVFRGAALIFSQEFETAEADVFAQSGFSTAALCSYLEYFRTKNVWMPVVQKTEPGNVVVGTEMLPLEDFRRSEFFNDWLKRTTSISASVASPRTISARTPRSA